MTVTEVAQRLGIIQPNLSNTLNEKAEFSPKMVVELSEAFGNKTQFGITYRKIMGSCSQKESRPR